MIYFPAFGGNLENLGNKDVYPRCCQLNHGNPIESGFLPISKICAI